MSFVLTNSSSQQLNLFQSTLSHWKDHDRDVVFLTEDGGKLYSSRKFLSVFSNMLRNILKDVNSGVTEIIIVQVPLSFDCMEALLSLLACGVSKYVDKDELFAAAAVIDVDNITGEKFLYEIVSASNVENDNTDSDLFPVRNIDHKKDFKIKMEIEEKESKSIDNKCIDDGEKYQCGECKKLYTHKDSLSRHIKTHIVSDGKPFECNICSTKFSRKYVLNNHMKMHPEMSFDINEENIPTLKEDTNFEQLERGVQCSFCDKEYSTSDGLKRHKQIHTSSDGKPFQCKMCDNRYTRQDTLSLHVKKVHGHDTVRADEKERYPCEQCDKTFSRKDVLSKHVRNMHARLMGQLSHLP